MAQLYGPFYRDIWTKALCLPPHQNLSKSLAAEFAEYVGISVDDAEARMREAWARRSETIRVRFPRERDSSALELYYREFADETLAYSLYWHALVPDRWALHSVSALHRVLQYADGPRVFEFGHGIGSTAILFARHGLDLTLGDISTRSREFAEWRMRRRRLEARFVDLTDFELPCSVYDSVISLDVLEHAADPVRVIEKLHRSLRPGGVMVLNVAFGRDASNPEHLLGWRTGVLNRVRRIGFERVASPVLLVFYKRSLSRARKALYFAQDTIDSLLVDLNHVAPGVWRLVRICGISPLE